MIPTFMFIAEKVLTFVWFGAFLYWFVGITRGMIDNFKD